MDKRLWAKMCLVFTLMGFSTADQDANSIVVPETKEIGSTKVLSRIRRYLIFPDGSSFQLVFCAQNQGYLQVGDIVWIGNTAALAWELPTDPNIYNFFIKSEKKFLTGNRREDTKHIVYYDEDGKMISKVPYHKKFIVNPAFAKRSVDETAPSNTNKPISKKKMHEAHLSRTIIHELDAISIKFHREGRKSLYDKVEKVLEGLGWSGKECLLRLLCENGKTRSDQGNFLQEIMKATFTFPRPTETDEFHKDYDVAYSADGDCKNKYPKCEDQNGVLFHTSIE